MQVVQGTRAPGHNTPVQLVVPGGAGLLASPRAFRHRGSEDLSAPSEEWCGMAFENASTMSTWELLAPERHQGDLGGKSNLSFQCWRLLLLGGMMTKRERASSCSLLWVPAV